jgi:hypothetical protein
MIKLYEKNGLTVDQRLVEQYLQNKKIAKGFSVYYDLFNKYKSDYQLDSILSGKASQKIKDRAKAAKFDERLALLGLILDRLTEETCNARHGELTFAELLSELKAVRMGLNLPGKDITELISKQIAEKQKALSAGIKASSLSDEKRYAYRETIATLEMIAAERADKEYNRPTEAFKLVKEIYDKRLLDFKKSTSSISNKLSNAFKFFEEVFDNGQEMLIFVTELTINYYCAKFISQYGCPEYFKHNKDLLLYERQKEIIMELEFLDLEN